MFVYRYFNQKWYFCIWILSQVQINLSGSEAGHPFTYQLHTRLLSARLNNTGVKEWYERQKEGPRTYIAWFLKAQFHHIPEKPWNLDV